MRNREEPISTWKECRVMCWHDSRMKKTKTTRFLGFRQVSGMRWEWPGISEDVIWRRRLEPGGCGLLEGIEREVMSCASRRSEARGGWESWQHATLLLALLQAGFAWFPVYSRFLSVCFLLPGSGQQKPACMCACGWVLVHSKGRRRFPDVHQKQYASLILSLLGNHHTSTCI